MSECALCGCELTEDTKICESCAYDLYRTSAVTFLPISRDEVVGTAHWEDAEYGFICSRCKYETQDLIVVPSSHGMRVRRVFRAPYYCPRCGARMEG